MADNHYEIKGTTNRSQLLINNLAALREQFARLKSHFDAMSAMLTGDGSQDGHFAGVATFYAIDGPDATSQQADAHGLYNELNATITGGSAALLQLLARTG